MKKLVPLAVVLAALLLAAGCGDDEPKAEGDEVALSAAGGKPTVEVGEGGPPQELVVEDLVVGDGREATNGDEVTVHYVGVTYEDGSQFDASWDKGEPLTFELGSETVIPGWEKGVEGMGVGGRRQLTIPPGLAYGKAGSPPAIPPHETVVLVVDLVGVS